MDFNYTFLTVPDNVCLNMINIYIFDALTVTLEPNLT